MCFKNVTMALRLYTFTVFSSFSIIVGDILQRTTAGGIDQLVTDSELFVKRIVHGGKISELPGYLLFTAPYKLCEGGCKDGENNFAMAFPIYVGKKGQEKYKELYNRDYHKMHSAQPDAPFKKRPTKKMFTLCPNEVTIKQTTGTPTETETIVTETPTMAQTTDTETTMTDTLTVISTTEVVTETQKIIPTTEALTVTESVTAEEPNAVTEIPATETVTVTSKTEVPTVATQTTKSKLSSLLKSTRSTIFNRPVMPTNATKTNKETKQIQETKIPQFTETEMTETQDITFEDYTDTTGALTEENVESSYIPNANGLRCPTRFCKTKPRVTPQMICLFLMLVVLQPGLADLPWRRWSWSSPQEPIAYFFRRHQNMPVKTPGHECLCPPSKECAIDYKINEDAVEFLNIQGILKNEQVEEIKEDIEKMEPVQKILRVRRNNNEDIDAEEECCCPPRNVMMPTIITEKKFNETIDTLRNMNIRH